jgi:hypothetical protein
MRASVEATLNPASGTSCELAFRRLAQRERRRLAQWCPGSVGTAVGTATRRCQSGGDVDRHWPAATAADEHVARLTKRTTLYHEYWTAFDALTLSKMGGYNCEVARNRAAFIEDVPTTIAYCEGASQAPR